MEKLLGLLHYPESSLPNPLFLGKRYRGLGQFGKQGPLQLVDELWLGRGQRVLYGDVGQLLSVFQIRLQGLRRWFVCQNFCKVCHGDDYGSLYNLGSFRVQSLLHPTTLVDRTCLR